MIDVATPPGGWGIPWPNVVEIEAALPRASWTCRTTPALGEQYPPTNDATVRLHSAS
jgi:hypothetical protein